MRAERTRSTPAVSVLLCLVTMVARVSSDPQRPLVLEVVEEQARGTVVGDVLAGLQADSVHLSLVSQGPQDLFHLDPESGILYTAAVLDREQVCPGLPDCLLTLNILAQSTSSYQMLKVIVKVIDINDNSPQFMESAVELRVSEASHPGSVFPVPAAGDLDAGVFRVQYYNLSSDVFTLQFNNNSDGGFDVGLVLSTSLDRETMETYVLQMTASDGGSPALTATLQLTVHVEDANDNSPKFVQDLYEVHIDEDTEEGAAIVQVQATDVDIGQNGDISYHFSTHTYKAVGQAFRINSETGEIFTSARFDFETKSSYTFTVEAKDKGSNPLPAYTKVVVQVVDVNDNPPHIVLNTVSKDGRVQVRENAAAGIFVGHVIVSDLDSGSGGEVTCSMTSHHFGLREVYAGEFEVVTSAVFDREEQDEYHLNLVCRDAGDPQLTSTKHAKVTVIDENDNAPKFPVQQYSVSISENNHQGALITTVTAQDADVGSNGEVRFALFPTGSQKEPPVAVDQSGAIYATQSFDYEKEKSFTFTVVAFDGGEHRQSSSVAVLVNIEDTNDEPPVFDQETFVLNISENTHKNYVVATLNASDPDSFPFNRIRFLLDLSEGDSHAFWLDELSGALFTREVLDREVKDEYHVTVFAHNPDKPNIQTRAHVTVRVLDENDNEPVISFPSFTNNTLYLSSQIPPGHVVAQVEAYDLDLGPNGNVIFSLENGSCDYFSLSVAGAVSSVMDLTHVTYEVCYLFIRVSDEGSPAQEALTSLVLVLDRDIPAGQTIETDRMPAWMIIAALSLPLVVIILLITFLVKVCSSRRKLPPADVENSEKAVGSLAAAGDDHNGIVQSILEPAALTPDGAATSQADTTWPHSDIQTPPRAHSTALESALGADSSQRHLVDTSTNKRHVTWGKQVVMVDQDESSDTGSSTDSGRGVSDEGESALPSPTPRPNPTHGTTTRGRVGATLTQPPEGATDYQRNNLEMCLKHPEYFRGPTPGHYHSMSLGHRAPTWKRTASLSAPLGRPVSECVQNIPTRPQCLLKCSSNPHSLAGATSSVTPSTCRGHQDFQTTQRDTQCCPGHDLCKVASQSDSRTGKPHPGILPMSCPGGTVPNPSRNLFHGVTPADSVNCSTELESDEESVSVVSADSSTTSGSYSMDSPELEVRMHQPNQKFGSQNSVLI